MSKKIALIAGGMGAEAEVSRKTGQGFAAALEKLGLEYEWVEADEKLPAKLSELKPRVALLAVHGKYAEDGTVQGICEYLKIPYTGSGVLASALGMNKYFFKQVLAFHKIPTPAFEFYDLRTMSADRVKPQLALPFVVKPSREGSSVGISIVRQSAEIRPAIELAQKYDRDVLIEQFIPGLEVTVPVVGAKALTPIEIVPKEGFYDYQRKYTAGQTEYILPPRLDASVVHKLKEWAVAAHRAAQARVYSRVDFRVTSSGEMYVIEINTLPGCTPTSLLPKAAAHEGIAFHELVKMLIDQATLDYEGIQ